MNLVWDEAKFLYFYGGGYVLPWRRDVLRDRTKQIVENFEFGPRVLCVGGALGWSLGPLVESGHEVVNFDTSPYLRQFYDLADVKPVDSVNLIEGKFDTVFLEDVMIDLGERDIWDLCSFADSFSPSSVLHFSPVEMIDPLVPYRTADQFKNILSRGGFSHHWFVAHNNLSEKI